MNCATPTDFTFSLQGFHRRGGGTDIHSDGWGIAFYQDKGLRQFHDVEAAATSSLADYLSRNPIRTLNMMGHIRYATVGNVDLANVHPFSREMWGMQWCFCHNGEVPYFKQHEQTNGSDNSDGSEGAKSRTSTLQQLTSLIDDDDEDAHTCTVEAYYSPIGTTDSEAAFCSILNALRSKFQTLPRLPVLYEAIQSLANEIVVHDPDGTIFNFLLTCGQYTQFAYSWPGSRPGSKVWNGLYYTVRQHPFTQHCQLQDIDYSVDFSVLTTDQDRVAVIATAPLTYEEEWIEFERGQLILFDDGKPHDDVSEMFRIEMEGHGLNSDVLPKTVLEEDMRQYNIDPEIYLGGGI